MVGKLIAIYGMNTLHKRFHSKKLVERLRVEGRKTELIEYPIYSIAPSGFYIDSVLRARRKMSNQELQLWVTLNKYQYEPILKRMLEEEKIVICKDYIGTSLVWGGLDEMDYKWISNLNSRLIKPDLSILLKSREFSSKREEHLKGREEHLDQVKNKFLEVAKELNWEIIDSNRDNETVFIDIIKKVKSIL